VEAKTFSVKYFPNNAELVVPTLSQTVTTQLQDAFISQTNLDMVNSIGDLHFEGEIVDYRMEPVVIQQNDQAAYTRLTIGLKVKYTNKIDDTFAFDKTFSRYVDYSGTQLTATSAQIDEVVKQLVEDIFNAAVVNW